MVNHAPHQVDKAHVVTHADDESEDDVLNPAQLAAISADTQQATQQQQQHAHQLQASQHHQQQQQQQHGMDKYTQMSAQMNPNTNSALSGNTVKSEGAANEEQDVRQQEQQSAVVPQPVEHDHSCFGSDRNEADEAEEELICMDDPRFAALSERRQKLMALEEVLLNTGIDG